MLWLKNASIWISSTANFDTWANIIECLLLQVIEFLEVLFVQYGKMIAMHFSIANGFTKTSGDCSCT